MNRLDRVALRKIKDSGNYRSLLKLKMILPNLFIYNRLFRIYFAINKQEKFVLQGDTQGGQTLKQFLEKNNIKFVF